ncbi:hypothetical protein FRC01_005592, partial [Tulasnella sp. 417]
TNIFEQPITERPEIPARFGEDGGKFYHYYDKLADELDEDLKKRLKSQLDSLLVFAGLFAGVNSAFLALTLPMMNADPTNDTNALLLQLVKGGNTTINSEADLPSATFSPPPAMYPVNVLFAVSLTCALMSSFLAVLGQQWLVYYSKRSSGGAEHQRKEQLRRQLGAQRWRLDLVLEDILPGLLQVGLVIFCISFILYLRTLSGSMSSVVSAIVGTALAITVGAAICATWDRMCPYQSPLSHLLCWTMDRIKPAIVALVRPFIFVKAFLHRILWTPSCRKKRFTAAGASSRGLVWVSRREETADDLIVASVKRVILASEHAAALIHAATNICAIKNEHILRQLLNDHEFFDRLHDLYRIFQHSVESFPNAELRTAATKAFATAILHMTLSVGNIADLAPPGDRPRAVEDSQPALLPRHVSYFWTLATDVRLETHLWGGDGDLKHVSHLQLLGSLLDSLFLSSLVPKGRLRTVIMMLVDFAPSRPLLSTLTCAVNLYRLSRDWDPEHPEQLEPQRLPQLFELVKATYKG